MKEKILAALDEAIVDASDETSGTDAWDIGYMRGLKRAKVIVNRLMEREEQAREALVKEKP
jgi:hypothetical protein